MSGEEPGGDEFPTSFSAFSASASIQEEEEGKCQVGVSCPAPRSFMEPNFYFTIGRMNPPTSGHKYLIKELAKTAIRGGSNVITIILSPTQEYKKNPLTFDEKVEFLKDEVFPAVKEEVIRDLIGEGLNETEISQRVNTMLEINILCMTNITSVLLQSLRCNNLYPKPYLVIGEDRAKEFNWVFKIIADKYSTLSKPREDIVTMNPFLIDVIDQSDERQMEDLKNKARELFEEELSVSSSVGTKRKIPDIEDPDVLLKYMKKVPNPAFNRVISLDRPEGAISATTVRKYASGKDDKGNYVENENPQEFSKEMKAVNPHISDRKIEYMKKLIVDGMRLPEGVSSKGKSSKAKTKGGNKTRKIKKTSKTKSNKKSNKTKKIKKNNKTRKNKRKS